MERVEIGYAQSMNGGTNIKILLIEFYMKK